MLLKGLLTLWFLTWLSWIYKCSSIDQTITQTCYGKKTWTRIRCSDSLKNGRKVLGDYEPQAWSSVQEIRIGVGCEGGWAQRIRTKEDVLWNAIFLFMITTPCYHIEG